MKKKVLTIKLTGTEDILKGKISNPEILTTRSYFGSPDVYSCASALVDQSNEYCYTANDDTLITRPFIDDSVYRAILSMAYGFTGNENESTAYYAEYCMKIMSSWMEKGAISLKTNMLPVGDKKQLTFRFTCDGENYDITIPATRTQHVLKFTYFSCGISDLMDLDKTTNEDAHKKPLISRGRYKQLDSTKSDYVVWGGWKTYVGTEYKQVAADTNGNPIYSYVNVYEPTESAITAMDIFTCTPEDWEELYYNPQFPSKVRLRRLEDMLR